MNRAGLAGGGLIKLRCNEHIVERRVRSIFASPQETFLIGSIS
jgi:hypothetical protein